MLRRAFLLLALTAPLAGAASDSSNNPGREFEARLSQETFSRFRLHYRNIWSLDNAWRAVNTLNEAYEELGSIFGQFPKDRIDVYLFRYQDFAYAWRGPSWRAGFFNPIDGKIRVVADIPDYDEHESRRIVRHEFAHAFEFKIYPHRLPRWFEEGSAEFYGLYDPADSFWEQETLEGIQKKLRGRPWLSLRQVDQVFAYSNGAPSDWVHQAYLQSLALVLQTARDHGDSWIPSMFTRLSGGMNFSAAYQDVVGTTADEQMDQLGKQR